jgi:acetyltransferase-like isoleucine patch superfamily enzyme
MTWRDPEGHRPELAPPVFDTGACVGSGSVVLAGVRIGERAMVGAGSVVTRDIPAGSVAFGNPDPRDPERIPADPDYCAAVYLRSESPRIDVIVQGVTVRPTCNHIKGQA